MLDFLTRCEVDSGMWQAPLPSPFGGTLSNLPLIVKDAEDNEVFRVNTDSTSTHTGLGTFEGGIAIKNSDRSTAMSVLSDQPPTGGFTTTINGNLMINGLIEKSAGAFRIDHPLDPENKYLYHSFVESPDMLNVYNGNVVLDEAGEAEVQLPSYFEALNIDYRYQLTAVGGPGPNLYVAQKISGNRFRIAGGAPGLEVSWQVTGIRNDTWVRDEPDSGGSG